ncbi:cytochrome p450 domain-containing protein [Ditylenchus destructor]|uniref:Cytochrome p450 domain-containing protein n=1 Tax=Ditylenchus destructor TaxID=166010 RepID=A0AAD4NC89_9BILA|nr:cytochrome p450 domain-containing protein [Ditylenchus destructor]
MILKIILLTAYFFVPILIFYNFYYKRRKLPPGPTPWPLLGNMLTMLKNPPGDTLHLKWLKKYGSIYTIWFSEVPVVCVSDYSTIIETFQKDGDTYAGRFTFEEFDKIFKGGNTGVVMTEGELWKDQRRFALHVLRDFGLGKNLMQERITTEIETLCEKVNGDIEKGIEEHNIAGLIDIGVGSIINGLLFGYRFHDEKEQEFYELKRHVANFLSVSAHPMSLLIQYKPHIFKGLPFFKHYYQQMMDMSNELMKYFEDRIRDHKQDFNEDEQVTDYVGAFLKEKAKKDRLGEQHYYTINQLKGMCFDLWVAGQETTSTTTSWGVAHMIHNPKVQERLHEELDRVIGSSRLITVADRPNLPYTCAVINETQRIANLVPNNVMHKTTRDVTIDRYFFPKGTIITPQVSAVLCDDKNFKDAAKFDPTRFLDEKGQLKRCDELIPFSVGKR